MLGKPPHHGGMATEAITSAETQDGGGGHALEERQGLDGEGIGGAGERRGGVWRAERIKTERKQEAGEETNWGVN